MMRCPECGSTDLRVAAEVCCAVVQLSTPEGENIDVLECIEGCEPSWHGQSHTVCQVCDHKGPAATFAPALSRNPSSARRREGDLRPDRIEHID